MQVEPLRIPLGVIRHQPSKDVFSRLVRVPRLLDQVEAAGPHWFPHPSSPTESVEQLTLEHVKT